MVIQIIYKSIDMKKNIIFIVLFSIIINYNSIAQISYPGSEPGQAMSKSLQGNQFIIGNNTVQIKFKNDGNKLTIKSFEDRITKEQIVLNNVALFELILSDNKVISSNDLMIVSPPVISDIIGDPHSITYANRLVGKKCSADFKNKSLGLNVHWEAHLRDGSNYVRNIFTFTSIDTVRISKITLIKLPLNIGVRQEGTINGVPMVHNNMFFAIEYPLSKIEQNNTDIIATLSRLTPISSSNPFTVSSVWGTTPVNQLRRGFLYYMERERAAPYHQISFYNSFGDIAWFDRKMSERACLERIKWIGDSLITKRDVQLTGFLFDDGWDDPKTLWQFHSGFPNGFTQMKEMAESYGSTLGVWISPFGGYREPKNQRLEYGKKLKPPFETNDQGFALSGPVYYNRYKEVLIDFVKKYDISMLKFDGVAGNNMKDMEAYLKVTKEIRDIKPDLYFFLTTGTWPSPFFIMYGDVVWRGGEDWYAAGEGTKRQQWITYRDAEVYKNVVKRSPLYPLNALQQMGIFICDIKDKKYQNFPGGLGMEEKDVSDDIWAALATGTSVQGLYINAYRMNTHAWDCLANALKWAKSNEKVMADTHWVGGDPVKGEIYGFAAWSSEKAVLTLRNPSKEEKTYEINTTKIFELPDLMENAYSFYNAKSDSKDPLVEGESFKITLQPFEVKVLNALPKK